MDVKYNYKISVKYYNHPRKSVEWVELEEQQASTGMANSAFIISA